MRTHKGSLTIRPVYANTLAAQDTVIKHPMLMDDTSMSCEDIHANILSYFVII